MKTTREYLFRGLPEWEEEYGTNFVYGYYYKGDSGSEYIIQIDDEKFISGEEIEVTPKTVGQYTGLTDKNGTKIFEGDIVEAFNVSTGQTIKGFVDFLNGTFILRNITNNQEIRYWSDGNHDWYSIEQYDYFELEVIGNIHQNKELKIEL